MKVMNLIQQFKDEINREIEKADKKNIDALESLYSLLLDSEYLVRAITDDFVIDNDNPPEYVYLFDLERNMFWKSMHGYTRSIENAELFKINTAKSIVENDISNNTKIIAF